jgi:hypothetical protein
MSLRKRMPATLSRIVEEFRVWLWTDASGSWLALHEDPKPLPRTFSEVELWGVYPTREEALCAIWHGQRELRATGRDRRKQDRRRWDRSYPERRVQLDTLAWTLLD